ncbi:MAG TPA: four helix bundle protein [Flavisolibacter sp.]|jgi:four helix bundle protein|nr:four helix bundle protein [Flavisolibacter sp.]
MPFKFEKLLVWKSAVHISEKVNDLCRSFPKEELYVLTSQMKRAADSISLNIAEGSTGQSNTEFGRFLGYTIRSGIEVVACLYIARNRNYVSEIIFKDIYEDLDQLIAKIQSLRKSLN